MNVYKTGIMKNEGKVKIFAGENGKVISLDDKLTLKALDETMVQSSSGFNDSIEKDLWESALINDGADIAYLKTRIQIDDGIEIYSLRDDIKLECLGFSITVAKDGTITITNKVATIDMNILGNISIDNKVANITMDMTGGISIKNPLAQVELNAAGMVNIKSGSSSSFFSPFGITKLSSGSTSMFMAPFGFYLQNVLGMSGILGLAPTFKGPKCLTLL